MNWKKIFSFLICTVLLLSTALSPFSVTVPAETEKTETAEFEIPNVKATGSGTCGGNLKWEIAWINEVTLTISGTGSMTNYSSSSKAPWYASRSTITKIVIENGVTSIGDYAFYGLSKVKSIQMPSSIRTIGEWAFVNCDSLTAVSIGKNVGTIGDFAFYSCDSLESITVDSNNSNFSCDINSVLFDKTKTTLIQYPAGAFRTSYTVPDSVKNIADRAFSATKYLNTITLGAGVESLGEDVFFEAYSLKNFSVSVSNNYFSSDSNGVLYNKNKTLLVQYPVGNERTSYTIPTGVKSIGYGAFAGCEYLTKLTIPNGVEDILMGAFESCVNLTDVTMPDSVKNVGYDAFMDTPFVNEMSYAVNCGKYYEIYVGNVLIYIVDAGITSGSYEVTVKDKTTAIAFGAFEYSLASNIILPDTFKYVGAGAFAYCDTLLTANIPNSVEGIGESAFEYCMNLTEVTLGSGVKNVSHGVFYGCESLDAINVNSANINYINDTYGALLTRDETVLVQYPVGNERTEYTVPDGVKTIGIGAFSSAVNLTSLTLPESLTSVGFSAFDICYNLTDVHYGGSEENWKEIEIDEYNDALLSANMTYGKESPNVVSIAVTNLPNKLGYIFGESFSLEGLVITATYTDGSTAQITDYSIHGFAPYEFGRQTVTVSYLQFSAQFDVYVSAGAANGFTQSLEAGQTAAEFKTTYSQYETYVFDIGGKSLLLDDSVIKTGCTVVVVNNSKIIENRFIVVKGDGTGDGIVNGKDLIRLKKYLLNGDSVEHEEFVDYNGDGVVNETDAEYLVSLI